MMSQVYECLKIQNIIKYLNISKFEELLEEPLDEDEILAVKNAKILYESCINESNL